MGRLLRCGYLDIRSRFHAVHRLVRPFLCDPYLGVGDTSTRIHHHRREGNPSQAAPVKEAKDRGFRNRLKKTMQARISGEKEVPRHPIENGLLAVNLSLPVSAHPIKQLINDANVEWEAKKEKQSQTLEQAVAEYKRRNRGMNPPKGFNKWWKFVM
jgi:hypothetical protein